MSKNLINTICLVLLLASVVCLFIPCWVYQTDDATVSVSVAEYISFPGEHRELTRYFSDYTGERKLTTRVALPLFILLLGGAAAVVGCAVKFRTILPAWCAVLVGAAGLTVCVTNIAVMLGSLRILQMVIYGLMLAAGLTQLVLSFRRKYLLGSTQPDAAKA